MDDGGWMMGDGRQTTEDRGQKNGYRGLAVFTKLCVK
jgi:hypothetical protein